MIGASALEGSGFTHTALVYSDWRERNLMIDSILGSSGVTLNAPTIISARPEIDARFFRRKKKRGAGHQRRFLPVVHDAGEVLSSQDPPQGVALILRQARKRSSGARPVLIGDILHLVYDRFETALGIENRVEEELSSGPPLPTICCYRKEGFYSLDPRHIIGVFETHRQVLLGPTPLELAR